MGATYYLSPPQNQRHVICTLWGLAVSFFFIGKFSQKFNLKNVILTYTKDFS
jgi:hypothetical protein